MKKRERLERALAGDAVDRAPVVFWRHWPGDDQRVADLVWSTLTFQQLFDWDLVKVTPYSAGCVADYGAQSEWLGEISGDRTIVKFPVTRSLAWTELRALDPLRGESGKYVEALKLIGDGLRDAETPLVATLYSPLTQAALLSGEELLLGNIRTRVDRLRTALNILTESTLRLIDALKRTEVAGIWYVLRHAGFALLAEEEYRAIGMPYDLKILGTLPPKWWLNILQLDCHQPMVELAATYPMPILNWDAAETKPGLEEGRALYQGVLCGGLSSEKHLHQGTPSLVRDVTREVLQRLGTRRLILSAGKAIPVSAPLSNLRAVRAAVESIQTG